MPFLDLLRHRGTLQKATVSVPSGESGEEIETWATVRDNVRLLVRPASLPADVRPGLAEEVTHIVISEMVQELLDDLGARWRWLVRGHQYIIADIRDPAERHHHLKILTRRLS